MPRVKLKKDISYDNVFSGFILTEKKSGKREYISNLSEADSMFDTVVSRAGMSKFNTKPNKKRAFSDLKNNMTVDINGIFELNALYKPNPRESKIRERRMKKQTAEDVKEAKAKARLSAPPPDQKMLGGVPFVFYSMAETPGMLDPDIRSLKRGGIKYRVVPFKGRYALYMFDPHGRY